MDQKLGMGMPEWERRMCLTGRLNGLVLSGGQSVRMGRDKGALIYRRHSGEDQRTRCFKLLKGVCDSVFISCRQVQYVGDQSGDTLVLDSVPGQGPGVGVLSAFALAPHRAWLILACDMPWVDHKALARLVDERDPSKAATAFYNSEEESLEPLLTIWEPSALLELKRRFELGKYSLKRALEEVDCKLILPPNRQWLRSVNDWNEYISCEREFSRQDEHSP
jgi:molybdopterin-guanine dinucleotide biosynthesis protein A